MAHAANDLPDPHPRRLAGGLLSATALLSMLAMAHHPHAHGGGDPLAALARIAGIAAAMHGVLLVLLVAMAALLQEFAVARVHRRALARSGSLVFALGAGALLLAGLVNGFAVPAMALSVGGAPAGAEWKPVLRFAWQLNQAAAGFGVLAWAAATLLWSTDLVRRTGFARWLGGYGLLAGAVVLGAVASHAVAMDVRGFGAVLFALALWTCGAGVLLWRAGPR